MMQRDTILLTGATGALGSILLRLLADGGYRVYCLVRAKDRAEAHARIENIVGRRTNVKAIRGDITEPRCGISDLDREMMVGRVKRIFHCAASIAFGDKVATHNTNVNGVHHVLELADVLDAWQLIHVSTAYVGGSAEHFAEHEAASPIKFHPRNAYEETKQIGETQARAWALKRDDRRLTIMRPSILIGCEDGTSPTFDAYYGYFKPLHRIAQALRERELAGGRLPADVRIEDQWVDIPLVLRASPTATLNIVPIDWCGKTMVCLLEAPLRNDVFHIVNPNPPLVRWVIDTSLRFLKIRGVHVVDGSAEKAALLQSQSALVGALQKQLDRVLDQYVPYTNHCVTFAMDRTRTVLADRYEQAPLLDTAFMERLLSFALKSEWGQKTLVPAH